MSIFCIVLVFKLTACNRLDPNNPTHPQTQGDFILTIFVDSTNVNLGQDINVFITFESFSAKAHRMGHTSSFAVPLVVGSDVYNGRVFDFVFSTVEVGHIFSGRWQLGSMLPKGQHELVAIADISIDWETGDGPQWMRIVSNTVILTVV